MLDGELERGRKLYDSRVSPELRRQRDFYNQAIVDILVKQYGNVQSAIW